MYQFARLDIREVTEVTIAVCAGIFFEHFLLVRDTVGLAQLFIIVAQALIQGHILLLIVLSFLLSDGLSKFLRIK